MCESESSQKTSDDRVKYHDLLFSCVKIYRKLFILPRQLTEHHKAIKECFFFQELKIIYVRFN